MFSNAVCKAEEVKLLSPEAVVRLSAADFDEAVKMLHDYGYDEGVMVDGSFDIDKFIGRQVTALIQFIREYAPNAETEEFLVAPYLFNNIKAEYKLRRGGAKSNLYEIEGAEGVEDGNYSHLDAKVRATLIELDETDADSRSIDLALTKAMYEYRLRKAKKSGSRLLIRYAKAEIDCINILTARRAEKLNLSEEERAKLFIQGGTVDETALYGDLPKEYEGFAIKDLIKLETETDNYLLKIADSSSSNMDSVGPLVSYVLRRNTEFKTVKMILVCIKSNARKEIPLRIRGLL